MKQIIHFPRISIMGLECPGLAIGMSVKRLGIADHVTGIEVSREDLSRKAKDLGAVDECTNDMDLGIRDCDLLILNLPCGEIIHIMPQLSSGVKPGCIVTDTSGIKKNIVDRAAVLFNNDRFFIGSHPMIYIKKGNIDVARGLEFQNNTAFVTFVPQTDKTVLARVSLFWKTLGMVPFLIDPQRHDRYMALVSHLPYIVACALTRMASDIPEDNNFIRRITGMEFQDTTHIAGGDVSIWSEILKENAAGILPTIDRMILELQTLKNSIEGKEFEVLKDFLTNISEFRNKL
jgi:prephenate dehydrogenase